MRGSFFVFLLALPLAVSAQSTAEVYDILDLIRNGQIERAENRAVPLVARYPGDPGVLYLQAILKRDGDASVEILSRIATEHRDSEWCDDALFRLHQYYLATGATNIAATYAARLRQQWPESPLIVRLDGRSVTSASALRNADKPSAPPLPEPELQASRPTQAVKPAQDLAASEARTPAITKSREKERGPFTAELRGLKSRTAAETVLTKLRQQGFTAELKQKGKSQFVVQVGIFPTRTAAQRFATRLRTAHHFDATVVPR